MASAGLGGRDCHSVYWVQPTVTERVIPVHGGRSRHDLIADSSVQLLFGMLARPGPVVHVADLAPLEDAIGRNFGLRIRACLEHEAVDADDASAMGGESPAACHRLCVNCLPATADFSAPR